MEKFNDDLYNEAQFKHRPKAVYSAYAKVVWEIFKPKSFLDLGCANGYVLDCLKTMGVKVKGLEAAQAAFKFMPESIKEQVIYGDLRVKNDLGKFAVVNFTEVAEHIDQAYEKIMLDNAVRSVQDYLIISWSNDPESQEHVNPRSANYVKKKIIKLGLYFEPELTKTLKQKISQKEFANWQHWAKNILVFSKNNPKATVLVLHHEFLQSYWNKNIGYFMQTCLDHKFKVKFLTQTSQLTWFKKYHRVWLYPYEKHLLLKLLILKLWGNKTIIKMDSIVVQKWRAKLISSLVFKVLAESKTVAQPFGNANNLLFFSGGLSEKNINLINQLKIKRQKQILFAGRQTYQKGIDRFKKIKIKGWKLKISSDLFGNDYYRQVLASSLVVLPTRGEGWPNVFSDAFFCRRLFLTTRAAKCQEGILNQDFYVTDFNKGLNKVIKNIDWYYRNYDRLYDSTKFVVTDKVFLSLIINQG